MTGIKSLTISNATSLSKFKPPTLDLSLLKRWSYFFSYLLIQYGVYVHIFGDPLSVSPRGGGYKSVYVCPFVCTVYAPKPLNRIDPNFMRNQLHVLCTAHGKCTIISVRNQTKCVECKLDANWTI